MQNRLAVALLGNQTSYSGPSRSAAYRWFTDPAERRRYPEDDHERQSRMLVNEDRAQALLIFTAVPGSEGYQKLELLSVIGSQRLDSSPTN